MKPVELHGKSLPDADATTKRPETSITLKFSPATYPKLAKRIQSGEKEIISDGIAIFLNFVESHQWPFDSGEEAAQ